MGLFSYRHYDKTSRNTARFFIHCSAWRDLRELTHLCCEYFLIRTADLLIKNAKNTLTP